MRFNQSGTHFRCCLLRSPISFFCKNSLCIITLFEAKPFRGLTWPITMPLLSGMLLLCAVTSCRPFLWLCWISQAVLGKLNQVTNPATILLCFSVFECRVDRPTIVHKLEKLRGFCCVSVASQCFFTFLLTFFREHKKRYSRYSHYMHSTFDRAFLNSNASHWWCLVNVNL